MTDNYKERRNMLWRRHRKQDRKPRRSAMRRLAPWLVGFIVGLAVPVIYFAPEIVWLFSARVHLVIVNNAGEPIEIVQLDWGREVVWRGRRMEKAAEESEFFFGRWKPVTVKMAIKRANQLGKENYEFIANQDRNDMCLYHIVIEPTGAQLHGCQMIR